MKIFFDVIFDILYVIYIVLYINLILASSKYFTTNGSVNTPIAFPMDKSLDISVFSLDPSAAVQFDILLESKFLKNKLT